MRKSTALYQGKRLLRYSVAKAILADDFTPEKLASILQDNAAGLLVVSEFTRLLDMLNRDYNAGLRQMLTELYDSPDKWVIERRKEKKRCIENAAISLLGATTLDWLEERVKARDLRGGFLARFLFLPAIERGPRVIGNPHVNIAIRESLKDHLWHVAELEGTADYSRPQIEITSEAMEMAQAFLTYIHDETRRVTSTFRDSWFEKQMQKAMQCIVERGGRTTRKDLYRGMSIESRKLDSVIKTLVEQGRIEVLKGEASSSGGPRPTIYTFIE